VQLPEGVPPFILINQNDFSGRKYTVEAIPLYDSAEDEPSSLKLPKYQSSFGLDFLAKNDTSMVTVDTVGPEHQLESSATVVEPLHSVPTEGVAINTVKTESNEEKKIYSQDTQSTFPPTNATASQFQSSSAFRNFQIGSGSLPKKKSFSASKKSKNNGRKQLDGKRVARLFASKQAQEEILKCEEIRNQAAAKLEASYDEIRPAIEEHERDSQDNVDISAAMTWIGASCAKMKADFNFHFAIVKNVVCPQPPQSTCGEAKPSEGAENENGAKY
ncbi:Histone-lysine N-methyltransferase, partial [Actinidia chinensis var. chinensis]